MSKNHLKYIARGSQWQLHSPSKSQGKSSCGFTHARTERCGRLLREWKPASAINFETHYLISEVLKILFLTTLKKTPKKTISLLFVYNARSKSIILRLLKSELNYLKNLFSWIILNLNSNALFFLCPDDKSACTVMYNMWW